MFCDTINCIIRCILTTVANEIEKLIKIESTVECVAN